MAFKKMDADFGFADLALASSLKHNRSLKLIENLNASINWSRIETILMNNYVAGTSTEGAKAYPPLLLFKTLKTKSTAGIGKQHTIYQGG